MPWQAVELKGKNASSGWPLFLILINLKIKVDLNDLHNVLVVIPSCKRVIMFHTDLFYHEAKYLFFD
jgi:hypothetical protein